MESKNILRRYTDVTSLLHILRRRKITLLDPTTWEDKNDSKFLAIYKDKNNLKTLLALCFTDAPETSHHWKVFSPGSSGICIRFNKIELLNGIEDIKGINHGKVIYKSIDELEKNAPITKELPFLKRYPFRDEEEYRIIYSNKSRSIRTKSINIDLNSISNIVLSPSLHKKLADTLKETIRSIESCGHIKIHKTTLNDSKRWVACGKRSL